MLNHPSRRTATNRGALVHSQRRSSSTRVSAGKGAAYFRYYERNRRAKGGVFIDSSGSSSDVGPCLLASGPSDPQSRAPQGGQVTLSSHLLQQQQQLQDLKATAGTPSRNTTSSPAVVTAGRGNLYSAAAAAPGLAAFSRPPPLPPSSALQQQLLPPAAPPGRTASQPLQLSAADARPAPPAASPVGGQDLLLLEQLLAVCSQPAPVRQRQAGRTSRRPGHPVVTQDVVLEEQLAAVTPRLNRSRGVVVQPPRLPVTRGDAVPLPDLLPLPRQSPPFTPAVSTPSSTAAGGTTGPADSTELNSNSGAAQREVHIFWDLTSIHFGTLDPRVAVAALTQVLSCYGNVAGLYVYGLRRMFNWVPEAFLLQSAPERLLRGSLLGRQAKSATKGASSVKLVCPVCGVLRDNWERMHKHMIERHKMPAPPVDQLLPARSDQAAATAAAGAPGFSSKAQRKVFSHSGSRTLGRVNGYYNSMGQLFVPPPGLQMSTKYVLLREGAEMRLVQNQEEAVDQSLALGVRKLLQQLAAATPATGTQQQQREPVIVVVSDEVAHTGVFHDARDAGVLCAAVCSKRQRFFGARLTLDWGRAVNGGYILPRKDS